MSLSINFLVYLFALTGKPGFVQADRLRADRVQYAHYTFNVPQKKRKEFTAELQYMETQFADMKFIQANEQTYTAEEWIAIQLLKDFDGRDLAEAAH
jgi:hypothetical protein